MVESVAPLLVLAAVGALVVVVIRRARPPATRATDAEIGHIPAVVRSDRSVAPHPLAAVGAHRALPRGARTHHACPVCGHELGGQSRRCPECGALLVHGVPAQRAGGFALGGAVIGVLVGLFAGSLLPSLADRATPADVASTTAVPSESAGPAPAGVRAALDGMLAVGSRLLAARDALARALAEPAPDVSTLTGQLRAVDAEAAEGLALTAALDRWNGSQDLAADLRSFHRAVREAAAPGLRGDAPAAKAAGSAVIESLTALEALNARTIQSAREAGLLPPVSPSGATRAPAASIAPAGASPASVGASGG